MLGSEVPGHLEPRQVAAARTVALAGVTVPFALALVPFAGLRHGLTILVLTGCCLVTWTAFSWVQRLLVGRRGELLVPWLLAMVGMFGALANATYVAHGGGEAGLRAVEEALRRPKDLGAALLAGTFCANVAHLATVPPRPGSLRSVFLHTGLVGAFAVSVMRPGQGALLFLSPLYVSPLVVLAMFPAVFLATLVASAEKVAARRWPPTSASAPPPASCETST